MDPRVEAIPKHRALPPVYCCDCRHYMPGEDEDMEGGNGTNEQCYAPGNRRDTYLRPQSKLHLTPSVMNKRNKCPYWEPKITFMMWIKSLF